MNLRFTGNKMVVTSEITEALLKAAKTYAPDALVLVDDKDDEVFKVSYNKDSGSISKYGVQFNGVNTDGKLTVSVMVPAAEDNKEKAKEQFGVALANLAMYEQDIIASIKEVTDTVNEVFAEVE